MFSRGQIFEGMVSVQAEFFAISSSNGGRIGWLEFVDTKGPPFELDMAKNSAWTLVQRER